MISAESVEAGEGGSRSRNYPWGVVDVDNTDYCDLHYLEKLLIKYAPFWFRFINSLKCIVPFTAIISKILFIRSMSQFGEIHSYSQNSLSRLQLQKTQYWNVLLQLFQ